MVLGLTRAAAPVIIVAFAALALGQSPLHAQIHDQTSPAAPTQQVKSAASPPEDFSISAAQQSAVNAPGPSVNAAAGAKPAKPVKEPVNEQVLTGENTRTRFLIGLDKPVQFQVLSLSNPNRVIVDLPDVKLQLPDQPQGDAAGIRLVSSFRGGLSAPGKFRVVIDVTEPVIVESAKLEKRQDGKGQFLALQILPVDTATREAAKAGRKPLKSQPFALGAAGVQPPLPLPAQRPNQKAAKSFKPIIVLDPGHGGHDSGAEKNGAIEKNVVLAFGLALRDKLNKTGRYKVMMTRDDDKFVELSERVDYAERNKASLFIAIHADYAGNKARGATIYSLRESVAEGLKRSAKGEVTENVLSSAELAKVKKASDDSEVGVIKNILSDLIEREVETNKERTSIFSRAVIETMSESTNMRDDPDQTAGYRVLKTAQFPSVLIELAYVTNKEDAEQLKSDAWRDKVSDSIMSAIENYFSNQLARLPM